MISKRKILDRVKKKSNPALAELIYAATRLEPWRAVGQKLSAGTRDYASVNLSQIDAESEEGDTIVVLGKVLGTGMLNKRVRICALSFSSIAKDKIKSSKSEGVGILEEIKANPKAEGVKIIK